MYTIKVSLCTMNKVMFSTTLRLGPVIMFNMSDNDKDKYILTIFYLAND